MPSARYAFALGVRKALTPVAYGGKPAYSAGLTASGEGVILCVGALFSVC